MKFEDYKPMLACPIDLDRVDRYPNYTMDIKLDGIRCIATKLGNSVKMYTRTGHELHQKLPNLVHQLKGFKGDWVLDGEIGYTLSTPEYGPFAIDFNATVRVTGSSPLEAERKQDETPSTIQFGVFDMLRVGNTIMIGDSQQVRRQTLRDLFTYFKAYETPDIYIVPSHPKWDEKIYSRIIEQGGEGVILKNPDGKYQIGKRRANTWYKVKGFNTVDCKIISYEEGQGKYQGILGALVVQDPTGTQVRISGMTDELRHYMTTNFDREIVGKMCEVKYFGRVGQEKDGYRHPQFLRMRPDLDT